MYISLLSLHSSDFVVRYQHQILRDKSKETRGRIEGGSRKQWGVLFLGCLLRIRR